MGSELCRETEFRPHLVGEYRNIPTIGSRKPFYEDKEYAPHYNLEIIMSSYLELFNNRFKAINNSKQETHLITALVYFHNKFLNLIHPFADGNGRVCRIIMGIVMMKNNCPPVFPHILEESHRFEYVSQIVACEKLNSDEPLIKFLAEGMTMTMQQKTDGVF
ncbi:Fido domain containing protein [Flavobacteriaceae bacterium]